MMLQRTIYRYRQPQILQPYYVSTNLTRNPHVRPDLLAYQLTWQFSDQKAQLHHKGTEHDGLT